MAVKVIYSSNNSGGRWWLSQKDWEALEDAGWTVHWVNQDAVGLSRAGDYRGYDFDKCLDTDGYPTRDKAGEWLGATAKSAAIEVDNVQDAIESFESVTGQDASAEGCNCCGEPHNFTYQDEDGETHYSSVQVISTNLNFY